MVGIDLGEHDPELRSATAWCGGPAGAGVIVRPLGDVMS